MGELDYSKLEIKTTIEKKSKDNPWMKETLRHFRA